MTMIRLRATGTRTGFDALVAALHGVDGVERVEELADLMPHMDDEDSSSAGLPDDAAEGFHQFEVHAPNALAVERVRSVVEALARERGVAIEYDDPE